MRMLGVRWRGGTCKASNVCRYESVTGVNVKFIRGVEAQ